MTAEGIALKAMRHGNVVWEPIGLDDVLEVAELQTRVDRKYLLEPAQFAQLLHDCSTDFKVLEIDGLREFRYESVYFDTPERASYRQAASGSRSRFKVRTRSYLDSGECMLEVKTKGGRGETVKDRMPHPLEQRESLSSAAHGFIEERVNLQPGAAGLAPVLNTTYHRATLVDPVEGTRMTCDAQLRCSTAGGPEVVMDSHVLVETKSPGRATSADRALWAMRQRPLNISKYCIGLALLEPGLPANRWNRTLRRYFEWTPRREAQDGW